MGVEVLEKIRSLLRMHNKSFEESTHEKIHTSEEAARVRGVPISMGAKAIVLKAKGEDDYYFIMCVLPGDKRIDLKVVKKEEGVKNVRLASPEEVLEVTGCEIGSVPPFGNLFGLKVYVEKSLLKNQRIVFSAGTHYNSIQMAVKDYVDVVKPVIRNFAKSSTS